MRILLEDISKNPSVFISLLPSDWEESLALIGKEQTANSKFYILKIDDEICAGGIIFSETLTEMGAYKNEANYWFSKGYLYIGYVWVPLEKRNKNYGSIWLSELLALDTTKSYWLTIEDHSLRYFYEKSGFVYKKSLLLPNGEEQLFVSKKG